MCSHETHRAGLAFGAAIFSLCYSVHPCDNSSAWTLGMLRHAKPHNPYYLLLLIKIILKQNAPPPVHHGPLRQAARNMLLQASRAERASNTRVVAPKTAPALETGSVAEIVIWDGVQASTVAKRNLHGTTH